MYEAMRTRAPMSSKAAGLTTMIFVTAAAGYAMANGFGGMVADILIDEPTLSILPSPDKPVEDTHEKLDFNTDVDAPLPPPPPAFPTETFAPPDKPPPITIVERSPGDDGAVGGRPTPPAPVRKMPVLVAKDKPPYPPIAIRQQWQGVSELTACIDAKGRVTSANLARTSGHTPLDEAALKWVRAAKFKPGTLDGAAQAMCGASVFYEWRLDR